MIENTKMMKIFKFLEKNGKIKETHVEVVKLFNDVILEDFIQNNFKDEVENIYSWFYNVYDYELPMYEYNSKNLEIVNILNKLSNENQALNVEYKVKLKAVMNFNDQNLSGQELIFAIETFIKNQLPTLNLIPLSSKQDVKLESETTLNQDVINLNETKTNFNNKQGDSIFGASEFGKINEQNSNIKEEIEDNSKLSSELDFNQEVSKIQDVENINNNFQNQSFEPKDVENINNNFQNQSLETKDVENINNNFQNQSLETKDVENINNNFQNQSLETKDVENINNNEKHVDKDKSFIQVLIVGQIIAIISFILLEIVNLTGMFVLSDIISDSAFSPSTFMFILSMIKLVFVFAIVGLSIILLISIGKSPTLKSKILISSIAGISMFVQLLFYGNWLGVSGSIISLFFAIIAICIFFAMYRGAKFSNKENKM